MNGVDDPVGSIAGLLFGGVFLLLIGDALTDVVNFNLALLGAGFILVAVFLGVLTIVSVITTIFDGL